MLTKNTFRLIFLALSLIIFTACDHDKDTTTDPEVPVTTTTEAGNMLPIAVAGASRTEVQTNRSISFSSTNSVDPDGEIVSRQWLENGVTVARVRSFHKSYFVAGTYTIKLIVTDNDGATSSDEFTIIINPAPVVDNFNTTFENTTGTPIPTAGTSGLVTIDIDAANAVPSITKVTVTLDLLHTFDFDLEISLISPTGTTIILSDNRGGNGDNFSITTFDDAAATPIAAGTAPFNGSFIPDEPLASFIGENATGTWTLSINDQFNGDSGFLNSWSMTIE